LKTLRQVVRGDAGSFYAQQTRHTVRFDRPYDSFFSGNQRVVRRAQAKWVLLLGVLFSLSAPATQHDHTGSPNRPKLLLPGMGNHYHPISTKNPEAQKFFDQGLILAFAFNHDEAARSFRQPIELDPEAAMPYWGLAWVLGPRYALAALTPGL
jgi:hypothetical protein